MNETPQSLLLFGVIFLLLLFVAIFAATIVYLGRGQSRKRTQAPAVQTPAVQTPGAQTPAVQTPGAQTPGARTPGPEATGATQSPEIEQPAQPGEVMRVIRDEQTGQVMVEIGGQRYTHIRQIQDARVGRRVLWAIADLVRFTGGMATNPQAVRTAIASDAALQAQAAAPGPAGEQSAPLAPAAAPPAPPSPPARRRGVMDYIRRGLEPPEPAQALPSSTAFVDEIEAILQRQIQALASPPQFPVHVQSGEDGMLQIMVGFDTYNSADDIPDAEIRALIQNAVREWENK
ncbi:MAG: hypothetical protein JXA09_15375 [Anaerolineae bacterium]|nr:hypothetical protein [Anaerolineae bacterium]